MYDGQPLANVRICRDPRFGLLHISWADECRTTPLTSAASSTGAGP